MYALEINNLEKRYKNNMLALKGISLKVKKGDFFALLGHNGAGKSTTIGIINSLVKKTSGTVKLFDLDLDKDTQAIKRVLGVVPQEINFNFFDKVIKVLINQGVY
ncbi:MAG: ATP-binding cassette domain-containing protein, partial [Psittacicella sp.]